MDMQVLCFCGLAGAIAESWHYSYLQSSFSASRPRARGMICGSSSMIRVTAQDIGTPNLSQERCKIIKSVSESLMTNSCLQQSTSFTNIVIAEHSSCLKEDRLMDSNPP